MVERKKIAGGGGETGAGARGIPCPSLARSTFHRVFSFSSFPLSESLEQTSAEPSSARALRVFALVCAALVIY